MTALSPLFNAPLAVQVHVAGVLLALSLLPLTLWRGRRDRVHRIAGYVWVAVMGLAALSSFFINGLAIVGPFGPIHLISVYVIWGLFVGVRAAIRGQQIAHRNHMRGLALGGLGVAGLFAFLPGRMMNSMVFGAYETEGFWALAALAALILMRHILRLKAANRRLA